MIPLWIIAARKLEKDLKTKNVPLLAMGAAFSFVIMMFIVPIFGGSMGHAVGGTLDDGFVTNVIGTGGNTYDGNILVPLVDEKIRR